MMITLLSICIWFVSSIPSGIQVHSLQPPDEQIPEDEDPGLKPVTIDDVFGYYDSSPSKGRRENPKGKDDGGVSDKLKKSQRAGFVENKMKSHAYRSSMQKPYHPIWKKARMVTTSKLRASNKLRMPNHFQDFGLAVHHPITKDAPISVVISEKGYYAHGLSKAMSKSIGGVTQHYCADIDTDLIASDVVFPILNQILKKQYSTPSTKNNAYTLSYADFRLHELKKRDRRRKEKGLGVLEFGYNRDFSTQYIKVPRMDLTFESKLGRDPVDINWGGDGGDSTMYYQYSDSLYHQWIHYIFNEIIGKSITIVNASSHPESNDTTSLMWFPDSYLFRLGSVHFDPQSLEFLLTAEQRQVEHFGTLVANVIMFSEMEQQNLEIKVPDRLGFKNKENVEKSKVIGAKKSEPSSTVVLLDVKSRNDAESVRFKQHLEKSKAEAGLFHEILEKSKIDDPLQYARSLLGFMFNDEAGGRLRDFDYGVITGRIENQTNKITDKLDSHDKLLATLDGKISEIEQILRDYKIPPDSAINQTEHLLLALESVAEYSTMHELFLRDLRQAKFSEHLVHYKLIRGDALMDDAILPTVERFAKKWQEKQQAETKEAFRKKIEKEKGKTEAHKVVEKAFPTRPKYKTPYPPTVLPTQYLNATAFYLRSCREVLIKSSFQHAENVLEKSRRNRMFSQQSVNAIVDEMVEAIRLIKKRFDPRIGDTKSTNDKIIHQVLEDFAKQYGGNYTVAGTDLTKSVFDARSLVGSSKRSLVGSKIGSSSLELSRSGLDSRSSNISALPRDSLPVIMWPLATLNSPKPYQIYYDIGGHIGYFSFVANILGVDKVYAFEPMRTNYEKTVVTEYINTQYSKPYNVSSAKLRLDLTQSDLHVVKPYELFQTPSRISLFSIGLGSPEVEGETKFMCSHNVHKNQGTYQICPKARVFGEERWKTKSGEMITQTHKIKAVLDDTKEVSESLNNDESESSYLSTSVYSLDYAMRRIGGYRTLGDKSNKTTHDEKTQLFLKLDVEGSECDVLLGAKETLLDENAIVDQLWFEHMILTKKKCSVDVLEKLVKAYDIGIEILNYEGLSYDLGMEKVERAGFGKGDIAEGVPDYAAVNANVNANPISSSKSSFEDPKSVTTEQVVKSTAKQIVTLTNETIVMQEGKVAANKDSGVATNRDSGVATNKAPLKKKQFQYFIWDDAFEHLTSTFIIGSFWELFRNRNYQDITYPSNILMTEVGTPTWAENAYLSGLTGVVDEMF